jgi:PAS domain S-box-containing protein
MEGEQSAYAIRSFACRCLLRADDVYPVGSVQQMCRFFGTTEEDYRGGILSRIRRDIGAQSADAIRAGIENLFRGEDYRIVYPSVRADGSRCQIQLDAYPAEETDRGRVCDVIGMDITDLLSAQRTADKLAAENLTLTEDSPVGLGIYHIRGRSFELVYTNAEYYRVHCGSKAYWDSFRGKDALERILPEDRPLLYEEWNRTLQDPGHVYDARYRCRGEDGQIHWIRLLARLAEEEQDGVRICYASYINVDREKQAEARAELLQRKLLDTINHLPTISVLFVAGGDGTLRAQSLSDEFCRMMGCTQEEAWNRYATDVFTPVHPEDRSRLTEFLAGHLACQQPSTIAYRLSAGGGYKWVSVSFITFLNGGERYLYAVYSDIDEIKRRDEEMERQYITAQAFLDSLSDTYLSTLRVDLTQNRVESAGGLEPLAEDRTAASYDELLKTLLPAIPRERDREAYLRAFSREALSEAFRAGRRTVSLDWCRRLREGRVIWVRSTMNLVPRPGSGDIIAFETVEDINRSKIVGMVAQDILLRQYDFIAGIDAAGNTASTLALGEGKTVSPLPACGDYDSGMRAYVKNCVAPEEQEACLRFMTLSHVLEALEEGESCSAAFTVREDGALRNKRMEFHQLDRELGQLVLICTDFTEVQQAQLAQEERLRDALKAAQQASVAKTAFLSRMSHEIRTPMNAIIGMDTLAAQAIGNNEKVSDCISKIGISARYLLSLINDILDMSRIESGKMLLKNEKFLFRDFLSGINNIIYGQAVAKGLDYECILSDEVDDAYVGDAMKLQQVLINVLGNAVKFTRKGKVTLEVRQLSRSGGTAHLRFVVGDTGCGISEEDLGRIFEPFEQADTSTTTVFGGTGLGLAITKNLVNLMGGIIRVRSIVGVGSEFCIELPLTVDESETVQPKLTYSLEKLHTLVVDDDVIICEQTSSILRDIGMIGEWVASGREAVERVRLNSQKSMFYDFILIDWKMPDMDGMETTRAIRKIVGPDVTIIIISAYDWEAIEAEARAAGANLLISKPLFKSTLLSAFQRARGETEARKEPPPSWTSPAGGSCWPRTTRSTPRLPRACWSCGISPWRWRPTASRRWRCSPAPPWAITTPSSWTCACPSWTGCRPPETSATGTRRTPGPSPSWP